MTFWGRVMAGIKAFRDYGSSLPLSASAQATRYALLGAFYTGTWRNDPRWAWGDVGGDAYRNSRQIVKQTGAIIDLYDQLVYQGDLSTDGQPLPDGTRGAIPIDPQTGQQSTDDALLRAFYQGFAIWQWRMHMSLIPKTAAIFGDVLVELVDDYQRGVVMPHFVYPGYVPEPDLELDDAGNIKRYAIEYDVKVEASTAFGKQVQAESYRFRKEVDGTAIRYYRDDKPFAYPGMKEEEENPYGFVPAVWCRHELVVGSNRGIGAFEKTLLQAMEINSTLSAALDAQNRQFGAPIGVIGSLLGTGTRKVTMPGGSRIGTSSTVDELEQDRRAAAQEINLLPMQQGGQFITIPFDVGKTMEMMAFLHERLANENPAAEWGSKVLELKQATGPGVQRILSPIAGPVISVRRNHDPQMVKLCQMNTAIMGYRLNNGDIPQELVDQRPDRYKAFEPYDLTSYGKGLLDATIPSREVFPESRAEKAAWVVIADGLQSEWAMREMGMPEEVIQKALADKEKARQEMASAFSVAGSGTGSQQDNAQEQNGSDQQGSGQSPAQGEAQA